MPELGFFLLMILVALIAYWSISLLLNTRYNPEDLGRQRLQEQTGFFDVLPDAPLSKLSGMNLERALERDWPMAVVIENYAPIRDQQSGLNEAAIVYETLTEGGITRFLAIFNGDSVDRIGPVRSARPYFVSWASEYRAALAHVGGSPEALENLKNNARVLNIDEFADSKTIIRLRQYSAPHNAYTSTDAILKKLMDADYEKPLDAPRFIFKEADDVSGDIRLISVNFSTEPYLVKYIFDEDEKKYLRYNGETPHHNIKAANVIIQYTSQEILDHEQRRRIQTTGTGRAIVFRDGQAFEAIWQRDASVNDPNQPPSATFTRFFDKQGKEIELNRGQTWIEVVPADVAVNYF